MKDQRIRLIHGNGGHQSQLLFEDIILTHLLHDDFKPDDAAVFRMPNRKQAMTTDSFVIDPVFFPGGNIGELAVCGTVNDLAMVGAQSHFMSVAFIIEEGFLIEHLILICQSMRKTASKANVMIQTGDTKVVPRGNVDQIYINTTAIGIVEENIAISGSQAKVGDSIILTGPMGFHGAAIVSARSEGLKTNIRSDCRLLNECVSQLLGKGQQIHCLRDATRGGVGQALNEMACQSCVTFEIDESKIEVDENVKVVCELMGFDPFYLACEGTFIAIVAPEIEQWVVNTIKQFEWGKHAAVIGKVVSQKGHDVIANTPFGGQRVLEMLSGELVPRIC